MPAYRLYPMQQGVCLLENQFAQEELSRQRLYLADVAEIMKVRARGPVPLAYLWLPAKCGGRGENQGTAC